jgi:hypothetical protein
LAGSLWGRDTTLVLQPYHSLICSKIDYGSFIYSSASKSNCLF